MLNKSRFDGRGFLRGEDNETGVLSRFEKAK